MGVFVIFVGVSYLNEVIWPARGIDVDSQLNKINNTAPIDCAKAKNEFNEVLQRICTQQPI